MSLKIKLIGDLFQNFKDYLDFIRENFKINKMQIENNLETTVKHIFEKLKHGYKENIYQLALCYELESKGYKVQREVVKDISSKKMGFLGQVALNDPTPGKRVHSMTPPSEQLKENL